MSYLWNHIPRVRFILDGAYSTTNATMSESATAGVALPKEFNGENLYVLATKTGTLSATLYGYAQLNAAPQWCSFATFAWTEPFNQFGTFKMPIKFDRIQIKVTTIGANANIYWGVTE